MQMEEKKINWFDKSYAEIVEHIMENYHEKLHAQMKDLSKLTTTILKVHGTEHDELFEVHRLFHIIQINMIQHLIKQESRIFPIVKRYSRRPIEELLNKAISEINNYKSKEDNTVELLEKLESITDGYTAPEDGCATYERTYELLKEFHLDIISHLQFEEEMLFNRLIEEKE